MYASLVCSRIIPRASAATQPTQKQKPSAIRRGRVGTHEATGKREGSEGREEEGKVEERHIKSGKEVSEGQKPYG